jgi:hypothetical protein
LVWFKTKLAPGGRRAGLVGVELAAVAEAVGAGLRDLKSILYVNQFRP